MILRRLNRRTNTWLLVWSVLLVNTLSSDVLDCGNNYINIDIDDDCTDSTCMGECRNEDTCCLERCFEGDHPRGQDADCFALSDNVDGCSAFENQTKCLAEYLNKTLSVCWKHIVYYISNHPDVERINGFNPINCPCVTGQTRKTGACSLQQCENSTFCEDVKDFLFGTDVCCFHKDIFPREDDCDETETLDKSVHNNLDVSTVVQCQELCNGGLCKMPDASRLPACCIIKALAGGEDDTGLHGGVIAVIVIIIIVLVVVGVFSVLYLYRLKKEDTQHKRGKPRDSAKEITGVDEIIEEDGGATYTNDFQEKSKYCQLHDENMFTTDFTTPVHSLDRLRNGNTVMQEYENQGFSDDSGTFEEKRTYQSDQYRRNRSTISAEVGTGDNTQYVFDNGEKKSTDDTVQIDNDDNSAHSSEEDEHGF